MKKTIASILSFLALIPFLLCCNPEGGSEDVGLDAPVAGQDMIVTVDGATVSMRYTGAEASFFLWKFNTGETYDTKEAAHTFDIDATYSVALGISKDGKNYVWSDAFPCEIIVPLVLTKPVLGKDMKVEVSGAAVSLTYEGEVATSWKWLFDDDTVLTTVNAERAYLEGGTYSVKLGVSDGGEFLWSEPADFYIDLTVEPELVLGTKLYIGGDGVAEIDKDHHMTWLTDPTFDYVTERTEAVPHYSNFAWSKNDAGNADAEFFNSWDCTEFDYEIFVQLVSGKDIYFFNTDNAKNPIYVHVTGDYSWKGNTPSTQAFGLGKTSIALSASPVGFQVPSDGYYRISFNLATKEAYVMKANATNSPIFRCWPGPKNLDFGNDPGSYLGHGVWTRRVSVSTPELQFHASYFCGYKFLFTGFDSDQPYGKEYYAAEFVPFDPANVADYWKIVPVQGGAWNGGNGAGPQNGTWQMDESFRDKTVDITIYMNDTYKAYVHSVVIAN